MNTEQLKTKKTVEEFMTEAGAKAVSEVAKTLLDFHSKHAVKELSDFASQESKIAVEKDRESRWISVKERLPEDGVNVIVYGGHTGTRINVAWYNHQLKMFTRLNSQREFVNCTHWQPLPEPPKL